MDKEKVTEELVRQNGNQAAAVMADYAGQGGGGGGTSGIPTIDKNTQPNLVLREPTAEDAAKFHESPIIQVADLPDGKVPLFGVVTAPGAEPGDFGVFPLTAMGTPTEGDDGYVLYGAADTGMRFWLSEDWTLLGVEGME